MTLLLSRPRRTAGTGSDLGRSRLAPRFLLYSHDGSGLGHLRRNLNLAAALVEACPAASVLIATGSEALDSFVVPPSVDVLRLPGLRKVSNDRYSARRLALDDDEVASLRAALLATAVEAFRPNVLVADKHPAGVHGELVPALEALRASGGRAALGLRDVLDGAAEAQRGWLDGGLEAVLRFHDLVLVYGEQELLDPLAGSGLAGRSDVEVRYCGYVVAAPSASAPVAPDAVGPAVPRKAGSPLVIASAGGGEDGTVVLGALLGAARGTSWDVVAVTGPQAEPCDRARLDALAQASGATVVTSIPDLGSRLAGADAVVCMGGYNSLAEVLAAGVPAVCVPRVVPRTEQLVRAEAFAKHGLLRVVTPAALDPARLRSEVGAALATDRAALADRVARLVRLDGRHRAAAALLELAGTVAPARAPASVPARVPAPCRAVRSMA